MITAGSLAKAMGCSVNRAAQMLAPYSNAAIAAGINNPNRAAMWAAQLGHESVGLQYMEEIHDGSNYEWRKDLGNVYAGDGKRFKGRGPIQLTGRNNYRAFTRWARTNGHSNIDFEAEPWRVAEPHWGFLAATYYWTVSRPDLNKAADARDVLWASRLINGWVTTPNGMPDRQARYNRCIAMAHELIPSGGTVAEKVLDYPRDQVHQDTFYNCGPATAQTLIRSATGRLISEADLGRELRTHQGGTDYIGQFPAVLNRHLPAGKYIYRNMPNDPPSQAQKDRLWVDIVNSINAGYGVVANIVAPPSNYPRAVLPSTTSPAYSGGTVYHYFAVMGYSDSGGRRCWIADSGFSPYGYWISFDQLCTLIPPKGYAYSTAETPSKEEGLFMSLSHERQEDLARKIDRIHFELTHEFQSEVRDAEGNQSSWRGTLVGYILQADQKLESINEVRLPAITSAIEAVKNLIKKEK